MKRLVSLGLGACLLFLATSAGLAQVKADVGHNDVDHATADFKFKEVPSPAKTNAASTAKITLVDGEADPNGADVDALNDGKLPTEQDQPDANFFFDAGSEGGRIVIDLKAVISVKQVNTYSWHTDTRAPQVYTLYGADGTAAGFNAKPGKDTDPVKAGWKLIAKVDTRPKTGEPGGQYGVSISDPAGTLGKYRYLLLAAVRTESDDDFGNTFYSEINVIDAAKPAATTTAPATQADKPTVKVLSIDGGKYSCTMDTTGAPDLTDWANNELAPVVIDWYPKIVKMLPSDGFTAPTKFIITFRDMTGVAFTSGRGIVGSDSYFKAHRDDKGAIVHEMVHVVQQFNSPRNPTWLVEGLTDYVRWFNYEPVNKQPRPNPARAKYTDSYQTTAAFINYVCKTYDRDFFLTLNTTMRQGKYTPDFWKTTTGKTVDDLWADYMVTLK